MHTFFYWIYYVTCIAMPGFEFISLNINFCSIAYLLFGIGTRSAGLARTWTRSKGSTLIVPPAYNLIVQWMECYSKASYGSHCVSLRSSTKIFSAHSVSKYHFLSLSLFLRLRITHKFVTSMIQSMGTICSDYGSLSRYLRRVHKHQHSQQDGSAEGARWMASTLGMASELAGLFLFVAIHQPHICSDYHCGLCLLRISTCIKTCACLNIGSLRPVDPSLAKQDLSR